MKLYHVEFFLGEDTWGLELPAVDLMDAGLKLRAIIQTGRIKGEIVATHKLPNGDTALEILYDTPN